MKLIYIAGRYRDERGAFYIKCNILEAERYALYVWMNGGAAICPHKNTAFFDGAHGIKDETWLKGDIEILSRCDAVWAIPGWESSDGAMDEISHAECHSIPVLYSQAEMIRFLKYNEEKEEIK